MTVVGGERTYSVHKEKVNNNNNNNNSHLHARLRQHN